VPSRFKWRHGAQSSSALRGREKLAASLIERYNGAETAKLDALNPSMAQATLETVGDERVLCLTTVGRNTGLPREIEIWFVLCSGRFYLFAETGEEAGWVKNIRRNPKVSVRVGECRIDGQARVLGRQSDCELLKKAAAIAEHKYGWSDGLPVEITPLSLNSPTSLTRL
jgi:deazaflavin-dependent oxidoreductase (nitroreductase family)